MKIKEEHLDTIVNNPYTNTLIHLRFLEEGMYLHINKHYPEFFYEEVLEDKVILDINNSITNDIKDED